MHRDTNGAGLVSDGASDGLANPPCGVGGELVSAAVFELVDSLHQADVTFLYEIEELQAAVGIFFGDGNNKTQVSLYHFLLGTACTGFAHRHVAVDFLDLGDGQPGSIL